MSAPQTNMRDDAHNRPERRDRGVAIVHAATKLGVGVYNRNNQRSGINWAEDFAFEARLRTLLGP